MNYKDILTDDDLLETFGNDENLKKMKKTIRKSEKIYLSIWSVLLIIGLLIVEYLSSDPTYQIICKSFSVFCHYIKK